MMVHPGNSHNRPEALAHPETSRHADAPNVTPVVEELIGSLCGQIEAAEDKAARWGQELMAARKRANEAERALAEAIDALRPFAAIAEPISEFWDGERRLNTLGTEPIRVRHVRRARALVTLADARASASPLPTEEDGPGKPSPTNLKA